MNEAVTDMMYVPVILEINLDNYYGKTGNTILIKATGDFMVASVTVEIYDRDGSFIEGGNAQQTKMVLNEHTQQLPVAIIFTVLK